MSEDEQAIRQLGETRLAASPRGDIDSVPGLMTDDVVFMAPGREPFGKDAFEAATKGAQTFEIDGKSDIQEIEIARDFCLSPQSSGNHDHPAEWRCADPQSGLCSDGLTERA